MTKAFARLALFTFSVVLMLANYWFAFGLWPKSWLAFALCACGQIAATATYCAVVVDK